MGGKLSLFTPTLPSPIKGEGIYVGFFFLIAEGESLCGLPIQGGHACLPVGRENRSYNIIIYHKNVWPARPFYGQTSISIKIPPPPIIVTGARGDYSCLLL